ncbi:putative recombination protein with metallo-hydrolase domain [Klebsiella pneumoniae subsp. ozaenae]|uniref:Putative recombination protein with metallo-hydrolase domain n=1 Tax=Klebsiella pneumoniae subsp. ozaenae TaxID=574 RepID=A0A378BNR5_KLEPO|nr:putative recombination protein with metallo-hydrolase domain [Klebsiella pneumoniae subsp. ozaenae]
MHERGSLPDDKESTFGCFFCGPAIYGHPPQKKRARLPSEAIVWNAPRKPEFAARDASTALRNTAPLTERCLCVYHGLPDAPSLQLLPLLWLPVLPGPCSLAGASALALALIRLHGRAVAGVAMTLLLVVWGVLSAHQALWPTRHLTGAIRQAEVILSETDGQTLHRGQMVRLRGRYLFPPGRRNAVRGTCTCASLCGSTLADDAAACARCTGQLNDGGFDSQRYALAQHRPLSGGIVAASALDARCSLRAPLSDVADPATADLSLARGDVGIRNGGAAVFADGDKGPDAEHGHFPSDGLSRVCISLSRLLLSCCCCAACSIFSRAAGSAGGCRCWPGWPAPSAMPG